jgi:hypothetical protein
MRLDDRPHNRRRDGSEFSLRLLQAAGERGHLDAEDLRRRRARNRAGGYWNAIGRLKPGVTVAAAQAELEAVSAQLAREFPRTNATLSALIVPLRQHLSGDVRVPFLTMLGAVVVVLAIACANVSALMVARGMRRVRGSRSARRSAPRRRGSFGSCSPKPRCWPRARRWRIAPGTRGAADDRGLAPADMPPLGDVAIDGRVLALRSP